jgi:hypothetical protein
MDDSKTSQAITHIIMTGDPLKVNHAVQISQEEGSVKKIIIVVPEHRLRGFEKIRSDMTPYFKEIVVEKMGTDNIAQSALHMYDIIRGERKQGHTVIINIADSSLTVFTLSGYLAGSVSKSKVIASDTKGEKITVPLLPHCRMVQSRYEILRALGTTGAENTQSLRDKLAAINQNWKNVEDSNMSVQLKTLEERGFIVRGKHRPARSIDRTPFGLLVQKAYEDDPRKAKTRK